MSYSFTVKFSEVRAVLFAAATKDIRFYLNGVLFDFTPEGLNIVATDGHRLHALRASKVEYGDEKPATGTRLIVPEGVLRSIKVASKAADALTITVTPNESRPNVRPPRVVVKTEAGQSWETEGVEGVYPDYWRVMGRKDYSTTNPVSQIAPDYLRDVSLAIAALGAKRSSSWLSMTVLAAPLNGGNPGSNEVAVVSESYPNFIAILMPYRADLGASLPAWLSRKTEKVEEFA